MNISGKLKSLEIGESFRFPSERYKYINSLIGTRLSEKELYFKMERRVDEVKVTRIKKEDRPVRRKEILAMIVGESIFEIGDNYRTLYGTVSKLEKQGLGKWEVFKDGKIVKVKRTQ